MDEAVDFYLSVFPESKLINKTTIKDTPSGDCNIIDFELFGHRFEALEAGPLHTPTPAISLMVNFDPSQMSNARELIDEVWNKLVEGGKVLIPLDKYPYSERYGWVQDKYGFSWQLIYTDPDGEPRPPIIPAMLFVTDSSEIAKEATDFYLSVFKEAERGQLAPYPAEVEPNKEGAVMFTDFRLENQWFVAMDGSSKMHDFSFNEMVSFVINCKDQAEID